MLAPPGVVFLPDSFDVGLSAHQAERPGTIGVQRGELFFFVFVVQWRGAIVFLRPCFVHDVERGDVIQKNRVHLRQFEFNGVVVNLSRDAHLIAVHAELRIGVLDALHGEHHVIGGERCAVVKLHALAQCELPSQRVNLLPRSGQTRHALQLFVALN